MFPRRENPFQRRRRAKQAALSVDEKKTFHVTAEELAGMHPLVRALVGAVTSDAVESTTVYDGQGRVLSVRTKRKQQHYSLRELHSLLNSAGALIQMEQQLAGKRRAHDLEGQIGDGPARNPS